MSSVCCSESQRALDSRDIIINILMTVPLNHLINDVTFTLMFCTVIPALLVPFCKLLKITRFTNNITKEDTGQ